MFFHSLSYISRIHSRLRKRKLKIQRGEALTGSQSWKLAKLFGGNEHTKADVRGSGGGRESEA